MPISIILPLSLLMVIVIITDGHSEAAAAAGGGGGSSWPSGVDTYMSESWAVLSRMPQPSCVDIPRNFTLCHGIDYSRMRLPNLVDHETLDEARFLCSLFAPVCLERAIYPCRSLCETVKAGCEKRMQMYGFPWPEMLNCKKFPVANDMCIKPRENYQTNKSCTACNQVGTYENILDHFCRSDLVLKIKVKAINSKNIVVQKARTIKPREVSVRGSPQQQQQQQAGAARSNAGEELKLMLNEKNENCPCPVAKVHRNKRYLAMAYRNRQGTLVLNLLLPWRKEKQFKKALKMFRKLDCKTLGTQIRERARRERRKKLRVKQQGRPSPTPSGR
ncbi:secreted frizzled protein [Trichuris trichiura]|uniref:Secreted frizzled protein n=1 Tax=Trichuris trichiura TaxID=36087 RepID=A0A077Z291_TRITR|nr:secreted frizzled protein [Trichuris trichiura]